MFFRAISYLKFLVKSTNQHGVHSPFVYDFVTKGLYQKVVKNNILNNYTELKCLSKKEQKVVLKIVNYFNIDEIYFDLKTLSKSLSSDCKILFINNLILKPFLKDQNNYFIVINKIHRDKKTYNIWKKLIKNNQATVTIDLFYLGLIFFRKEQQKEHFTIRV
ncbi:hypothetical protein [uncultured Polaribacter sp.]|uniref:hypothetical protein n=1 Tax=uncultured Polaribacter sp. TaxID=174711 RepID=UPI00261EF491|nr:hypothetical protein [uncultured Polaribacter sp.]